MPRKAIEPQADQQLGLNPRILAAQSLFDRRRTDREALRR